MRNTRTPGAAGARNTGAYAARSDFVAFCDDDDEWLPDKLEHQVRAVLDHGASVATGGIEVVFRGGTITRLPDADSVTLEDLLRSRRTDMHTSTMLVWRSAFIGHIGPFDETIPGSYGEDYDWLLRAARVAPILTPRLALATIHWHQSSFFEGRWQMIIDALTYLLAKHPEFARDPKGVARIYGQLAFASAALGRSGDARRWIRRTLGRDIRQPRAYLALLVATRIVAAGQLLRFLHRFGRSV
jgi:glycosyltransferase involved in cell wall biosynthesis